MSKEDLEDLAERLATLEQELVATRSSLATVQDVSGIRRRRRWLAATIAAIFILSTIILPVWRASAQGPSALDAQVRDLTRRVAELENKVESHSKDISDLALLVQNHSKDISDLALLVHNQSKDISDLALLAHNQSKDISDLALLGESLGKDIGRLTNRIDALEAQPPGTRSESLHKVTAPFTVVDAGGTAIFQVLDANGNTFRGAFVFNPSNRPVASLEVNPQGIGAVRARAGDGQGAAVLFADETGGFLRIRSGAGKVAAEIAPGGVNYFGSEGNATVLSALTENEGRGAAVVYTKGGTPIAFLTQGKAGGGNVTLNDPSGGGVFSAGHVEGGANACLDLPKQGLKCFGIGLPMTFSIAK